MSLTRTPASVEAWLEWFEAAKSTQCRAYLCMTYGLNALNAEALMNTARLQVFRYWATIKHPLAYFWQTLTKITSDSERTRQTLLFKGDCFQGIYDLHRMVWLMVSSWHLKHNEPASLQKSMARK